MDGIVFSEEQIQQIFGHEAAEDEDLDRLRNYYFKSSVYEMISSDLPLRILVGHKGVGKSALFQVAIAEDNDANKLTLFVRPDDITDLSTEGADFLKTIRLWKNALIDLISSKVLLNYGVNNDTLNDSIKNKCGMLIDYLKNSLRSSGIVSLLPTQRAIVERFLKDGIITVYIDDLDRGWEGRRSDVSRISALLNAVRDLIKENKGLRFRISLRSSVYYLVRTSDESTDKIESSVVWHTWKNHDIFVLLVKRIETFFGRSIDEEILKTKKQKDMAHYLTPIMESRFDGYGHWANAPMYTVLMSLIRNRPRDLVKLCTLAARKAHDSHSNRIITNNFTAVFKEYSQGRIQDTINEYRSELPSIERLLLNMKPTKMEHKSKQGYIFTTDELFKKINKIMQGGNFTFTNGTVATAKQIADFLYKINFITARKDLDNKIFRSYFEDDRFLLVSEADFGFKWEIHPAYRWALEPEGEKDIFHYLELSSD